MKFALHRDTNDWAGFEREWQALNDWLDQPSLSSPAEKEVLGQINAAYDDYHDAARQMEEKVSASREAPLPVSEFGRFQSESGRLMDLSFQLTDAHRRTLDVQPPFKIRPLTPHADGQLSLSLTAEPGRNYVLQASTNLLDWLSLQKLVGK